MKKYTILIIIGVLLLIIGYGAVIVYAANVDTFNPFCMMLLSVIGVSGFGLCLAGFVLNHNQAQKDEIKTRKQNSTEKLPESAEYKERHLYLIKWQYL